MAYVSFNKAKKGDTTFLNEENVERAMDMLKDCEASQIFIHDDVMTSLVNSRLFPWDKPPLINCIGRQNPKLAFMEELESNPINPTIYHNDEEFVGGIKVDDGFIGAEPLNLERDAYGKLHQFTYQGNIRIGKNVSIANNVTIARGALNDTIIEDDVMLDTRVFVGNGAHIREGTVICVGAILGGGVKIGRDCFIGMGAIINPHLTIESHSIIGSGSVVTKNVERMSIVAGNPARPIKTNLTRNQLYRMRAQF